MSNSDKTLPVIVSSSSRSLTTATSQQRIASRMAENLLDVVRSQERALATQKLYRIGDYEFREVDHAQIQRWAQTLGMEPVQVVTVLAASKIETAYLENKADFEVVGGAIVSLVWDFEKLPLTDWKWCLGLNIERLGVLHAKSFLLLADGLQELFCYSNSLNSLNLAQSPQLRHLDCSENQLAELDLSPVPGLQELDCSINSFIELDLSPVPRLQELDCSSNDLTELDLSPVPGLQKIGCSFNDLTELDLSPVPGLQELNCSFNSLTELDLSPVSGLQELNCSYNSLTELDLSPVPGLQELRCDASVKLIGASINLRIYHS